MARPLKITKDELAHHLKTKTIKEIADYYKCTIANINRHKKLYNLKSNAAVAKSKRIERWNDKLSYLNALIANGHIHKYGISELCTMLKCSKEWLNEHIDISNMDKRYKTKG